MNKKSHVLALAGGVGGAKLVFGLSTILPSEQLTIVGNTADDEVLHGLHISPDLDTLMYTLADLANPLTGWGIAEDTFNVLNMLKEYGSDTWFKLGDKDLATHIERTRYLYEGKSLTTTTDLLCKKLGVKPKLAPMSDQQIRTILETTNGDMAFQQYFVKNRFEPKITGVKFDGISKARMSPVLEETLRNAHAIIFCPSNPIVSIGPILAIPGVKELLADFSGPRVAISPMVGDKSLRGPTSKMLMELGEEVNCVAVAKRLESLCDILVIDNQDMHLAKQIRKTGIEPIAMDITMEKGADKVRLAKDTLGIIEQRT